MGVNARTPGRDVIVCTRNAIPPTSPTTAGQNN
jgi:hypothetical protein